MSSGRPSVGAPAGGPTGVAGPTTAVAARPVARPADSAAAPTLPALPGLGRGGVAGGELGAHPLLEEGGVREREEERRFPLRLERADLVDALRLVAGAGGRSLEVGPGVEGTVTLAMRDTTAEEALERLKEEFGLSVEDDGEKIVVWRTEAGEAEASAMLVAERRFPLKLEGAH